MGNKVGRNDPCPCGSGKKYKKCCLEKDENVIVFPVPDERSLDDALRRYQNFVEKWDSSRGPSPTFNEFMGRPNMATEEIRNIQEAFQGREFQSKEEMNAFLQEFTEAQNKEPREEFLGLSSAQVHQMMYRRISESGEIMIVERNISANLMADVPALNQTRYLLGRIGENDKGMKATQKGNLPRVLARDFYEVFMKDNDIVKRIPSGEDDVAPLQKAKFFLRDSGFMKFRNGWYSLTKKGRGMLENFDSLFLYLQLFTYFIEEFNWLYGTRYYGVMEFIQRSWLFSLYILREKATDFIGGEALSEMYLNAFPGLAEDTHPEYGHIFVKSGFSYLFLDRIAWYLGLLESRGERRMLKSEMEFRTTGLFRELLQWKI